MMSKFRLAIIILLIIACLLLTFNLILYFTSKNNNLNTTSGGNQSFWQVLNWQSTIGFGFLAALVALFQAIFSSAQKMNELKWNKANLARQLVDDVYEDEESHDALRMIDQSKRIFTDQKFEIIFDDVKEALSKNKLSDKSDYIRDCFDTILYYFERIEHSIDLKVVNAPDVTSHFAYYMDLLRGDSQFIVEYSNRIKYFKAAKFIQREWT